MKKIALGVVALVAVCAIAAARLPTGERQAAGPSPSTVTASPGVSAPAPAGNAYALEELEAVKDYLTDYMDAHAILALDANEVTGVVDVCLQTYTQENMDQLRALMEERWPGMDCLHFEDYSDKTILFT